MTTLSTEKPGPVNRLKCTSPISTLRPRRVRERRLNARAKAIAAQIGRRDAHASNSTTSRERQPLNGAFGAGFHAPISGQQAPVGVRVVHVVQDAGIVHVEVRDFAGMAA